MIDKNSPIPVYYQLKEDILGKISNEEWIPGQCISSERELCEVYGVSRMTIRQAIGELVQEGVLRRVKGKGTFVCDAPFKQQDMMSFTEMMKKTNRVLKTQVVEVKEIDTPDRLKNELKLDRVYKIKRKRIVDNECIAIETVYIPKEYCGELDKEALKGSLFKILESAGYNIHNSESSIVSLLSNDKYKKEFGVEYDIPLLKISSKTLTDREKLLFIEDSIYRSDKFILEVNISRREGKMK